MQNKNRKNCEWHIGEKMVGIIEKNLKRDYVKDMSQYYDKNKMNE